MSKNYDDVIEEHIDDIQDKVAKDVENAVGPRVDYVEMDEYEVIRKGFVDYQPDEYYDTGVSESTTVFSGRVKTVVHVYLKNRKVMHVPLIVMVSYTEDPDGGYYFDTFEVDREYLDENGKEVPYNRTTSHLWALAEKAQDEETDSDETDSDETD